MQKIFECLKNLAERAKATKVHLGLPWVRPINFIAMFFKAGHNFKFIFCFQKTDIEGHTFLHHLQRDYSIESTSCKNFSPSLSFFCLPFNVCMLQKGTVRKKIQTEYRGEFLTQLFTTIPIISLWDRTFSIAKKLHNLEFFRKMSNFISWFVKENKFFFVENLESKHDDDAW